MKSVKSKRIRAIGLFIVLVSLITSFYINGFRPKPVAYNSRETDNLYNEMTNHKKIQINLSVKSIEPLRKLITTKYEPQGAIKVVTDEQSSYGLYIYHMEPDFIPDIINDLGLVGHITSKTEKVETSKIDIDLDTKLRDKEALYQKELMDYHNSKTKYSYLLDRIKQMGKEVDSLKLEINNQKYKAMTLLYVKAHTSSGRIGRIRNYQKFFLDFIKYMAIYTIIAAFLHYGTVLLMYILSLLGVRFPSLTSYSGKGYNQYAGYKGYRGYGNYGYGGSRKRRVKRIYKDKQPSSDNEKDDSDK